MRNERFEWDDEKARRNLAKHGVSFEEATLVFEDPNALIEADDSDPFDERWVIIGSASDRILYVVSSDRHENRTRIISARRATRHEEDCYYRQAIPEE